MAKRTVRESVVSYSVAVVISYLMVFVLLAVWPGDVRPGLAAIQAAGCMAAVGLLRLIKFGWRRVRAS